jgi:hypothetical protein
MDPERDPFERTRGERIYFLALLGALAFLAAGLVLYVLLR